MVFKLSYGETFVYFSYIILDGRSFNDFTDESETSDSTVSENFHDNLLSDNMDIVDDGLDIRESELNDVNFSLRFIYSILINVKKML